MGGKEEHLRGPNPVSSTGQSAPGTVYVKAEHQRIPYSVVTTTDKLLDSIAK